MNLCDRCGASLHGEICPEDLPGPVAFSPGLLPAAGGHPGEVRFCPLCSAELSMMGALEPPEE